MPVYNGERFVGIAIESVLAQTFANFELIISDNASSDGTEEICRGFAAADSRIQYHRNNENIGAAANYNLLQELAAGEYFRWSNADDVIAPTLHERCLAALDASPEAVLCYGKTRFIDDDGRVTGDYDDKLDLREARASDRFIRFNLSVGLTNVIYGLMRTAAVRRTAKMGVGTYPAADTNFMGELTLYGQFIEIPEPLFYRRIHSEASSAYRDDEERQKLFWSATASKFSWPTWRRNVAYWKAVHRAPIDPLEKLRSGLFVLRRMYWARRELTTDLLDFIRQRTS